MAKIKKEHRNWAMACHLSALFMLLGVPLANVIGPLVFWLLKREEHKLIDYSGKESLNFQISMSVYMIAAFILIFAVIGIIILPILIVVNVIYVIIASIETSEGKKYKYPLTIRFIK